MIARYDLQHLLIDICGYFDVTFNLERGFNRWWIEQIRELCKEVVRRVNQFIQSLGSQIGKEGENSHIWQIVSCGYWYYIIELLLHYLLEWYEHIIEFKSMREVLNSKYLSIYLLFHNFGQVTIKDGIQSFQFTIKWGVLEYLNFIHQCFM